MNILPRENISLRWFHILFIILIASRMLPSDYGSIELKDNMGLISSALFAVLLLIASKTTSVLKYKNLFYSLMFLCVAKAFSLIIWTIDGSSLTGEWIDVFLFSGLLVMVGSSFVMRTPYFYSTTKKKAYIPLGGLSILLSLFIFVVMSLALRDMYIMEKCIKLDLRDRRERWACMEKTLFWQSEWSSPKKSRTMKGT